VAIRIPSPLIEMGGFIVGALIPVDSWGS